MRVAVLIGKLMMNAVSGHPEDRSAFERQRCADGQKIFYPFGRLVAAMGEQAMVAHADPKAARDPPQKSCQEQSFPGKEEQRGDSADVERRHKRAGDPVEFVVSRRAPLESLNVHGAFRYGDSHLINSMC